MKTERRMVEREIFIADDGKEFLELEKCRAYEVSREFSGLLSRILPEPITIDGDTYQMVVHAKREEDFRTALAKHAYEEKLLLFEIDYSGHGLYFIGRSERYDYLYGDIEIVVAIKREDLLPRIQAAIDIAEEMDHILEEEG